MVYTGSTAFTRLKQKDRGQLGYKTRHYLKRKKIGGRGTMGKGGKKQGKEGGKGRGGKEKEREGKKEKGKGGGGETR